MTEWALRIDYHDVNTVLVSAIKKLEHVLHIQNGKNIYS